MRYPGFELDDEGHTLETVGELLDEGDEAAAILARFPDLWTADIGLWVALQSGEPRAQLRGRWATSLANEPLLALVRSYDLEAFLRQADELGVPDPSEVEGPLSFPSEFARRYGAFFAVRSSPPSPLLAWRDLTDGSTSLAQRASALRTILDLAGAGATLELDARDASWRSLLDASLGPALGLWFGLGLDQWRLDRLAGRAHATAPSLTPMAAIHVAHLLDTVVPGAVLDAWVRPVTAPPNLWEQTQTATLAMAAITHLRGTDPLRPFPSAITDRLRPWAAADGPVAMHARKALCLSEAAWVAMLPDRRRTIARLLGEAASDPDMATLFARALARERRALSEGETGDIATWFWSVVKDGDAALVPALTGALPFVGMTRMPLSEEQRRCIVRLLDQPLAAIAEPLRGFVTEAARLENWAAVTTATERLRAAPASATDRDAAKHAGLLLFEISELSRKDPDAREVAVSAFKSIADENLLNDDLDVQRALWRAEKS